LKPLIAERRAGDAIAVTSPRAARRLAGVELSAGVLVAAVGESTQSALAEHGVRAGFVGRSGARTLGRTLPVSAGARVLHPCALDTLPDLEVELSARGIQLLRAPVYRTRSRRGVEFSEDVDARIYMSPSSVRASRIWESAHSTSSTRRIAVGQSTAAALAEAGLDGFAPAHSDREQIVHFLCDREKWGNPR
jgi:uroporphyrinogen-III synthase